MNVKEYNLDDNVECLGYETEAEWHALRKEGIGGSDAGAVLGLNKYTTPLKLYKTKIGDYVEDVSDNIYIKKGKDLESFVFNNYVIKDMEVRGYVAIHPEHVFVNKQYPWLRANCDGIAIKDAVVSEPSENIIIEIKWVSEWAEVNWNGDEYCGVPASYYAQVQHYMLVTGARKAILYALFDKDWEVKMYEIPFNYSFAVNLAQKTNEFYNRIVTKTPPAIKATEDKEFLPEYVSVMPIETKTSTELDAMVGEYLVCKKELDAREAELSGMYDKIMERYLNGERTTELFKINVATYTRAGFDTKRFAADHPTVYEEYKTSSEYTRTTIKKK